MTMYLIVWKEFIKMKMVAKSQIVSIKSDEISIAVNKIKTLNAEKRLTTAEYEYYNLSEILDEQNYKLVKDAE